ncbi:hypothetical protein MRX96_003063 [Rhipicephalus microplus]
MECYAVGFQQHGVGPGDRVCTLLSNSLENLAALYGCAFTGATLILAKTSATERELRNQILSSDSTHVLVDAKLAEKVKSVTSTLSIKGFFAMGTTDGFVSATRFKDLNPSGLPKGVELTHQCFVATHKATMACAPCNETDTVLVSAPIGHTTGLLIGFMAVLNQAVWILTQPLLGLQETARIVNEHKVTWAFVISSQLLRICEGMRLMGERMESIRCIAVGGGPLTHSAYNAAFDAFGNLESISNIYGMTESGRITFAPAMRCGTDLGFPAPLVEVKVVDPVSYKKLGLNQTGEIWFRGPTVMRGYYKHSEETTEFFDSDGWGKTGDAGYYDEDGRLFFVQRLKEMIKCMENQVAPAELEELLLQEHSLHIAEVAVVGLPDTRYGEVPAAAIVPRDKDIIADPSIFTERVKVTIAETMAAHKHLYGGVFLYDSLPKNEIGKVNRIALVEMMTGKTPS